MPGTREREEEITFVYAEKRQLLTSKDTTNSLQINDDILHSGPAAQLHSNNTKNERSNEVTNFSSAHYNEASHSPIGGSETGCHRHPTLQCYPFSTINHRNTPAHYLQQYPYDNRQYYPVSEEYQYLEACMEGPMSGMRRKSLEGLRNAANMPPPHRILDVHNLDPPPYWIPLHQMAVNDKQRRGLLGRKRGGRLSIGEKISHTIGHHNKCRRSPQPLQIEKDRSSIRFIEGSATIDVNVNEATNLAEQLYPIFLPMDQAFKTKYVFAMRKKRGKSIQERVYAFLEHPCGWACFTYHFIV